MANSAPLDQKQYQELFYTKSTEQIIQHFHSNLEKGLTEAEAKIRVEMNGENRLPEPKKVSAISMFFKQFANFMIYILLGATILSLILGDLKDAILIGVVVVINAIIGFYQEYKAEKTLASLKKMSSPTAHVIREGQIKEIATHKLVTGDIVVLEEGDIIPADLRLTESIGLEINEAILTGESVPSQKDAEDVIENKVAAGDQLNMAFMGTVITSGNGHGIVIATSAATQIGKIAQTLAIPYEKPTPLQRNLNTLGKYIVTTAFVVAVLIFIVGIIQGRDFNEQLFTVISLAVAVIPEGLVAVVTVTMAIGVQRMAKRNAIVRSLPAVETLGAVNVICSDKTGTLTEGKMVVSELWTGNKSYSVTGTGIKPDGALFLDEQQVQEFPPEVHQALVVASLCNDAVLQQDGEGVWGAVGDTTEIALQVLAHKLNVKKEELERRWKFVEGLPFDSDRKRMSVIYNNPANEIVILTKGAPEEIISACTKILDGDEEKPIDEGARETFSKMNIEMAARGLRVLGLAIRTIPEMLSDIEPGTLEKDLTFIGLVGVLDPARPEAKKAVSECRRAGIKVMMITGDHPATAANIAANLGIFDARTDKVMTGDELDNLTEEDLMKLEEFPKVFARVSPENKLMLISVLRKMNYVVAMTGDGVNDAAAIKHSNVGVAMGKEGTDVTRQAADIILSDDNFATIVNAVEEGRRIFTNIRKFIRYLLSCNVSNVFSILFATLLGIPLPFTPIQILWLNLVTDTPPALALGFDGIEKNTMTRPPRDTTRGIFRKADILFILYHGLLMALLMLVVFLMEVYVASAPLEKARTMAFAMLVLAQLTQAFNAKSTELTLFRRGIFNNRGLDVGVGISVMLLVIGIYFPVLSGVFEQVSLNIFDWLKLLMGIIAFVIFSEFFKLLRRRYVLNQANTYSNSQK